MTKVRSERKTMQDRAPEYYGFLMVALQLLEHDPHGCFSAEQDALRRRFVERVSVLLEEQTK